MDYKIALIAIIIVIVVVFIITYTITTSNTTASLFSTLVLTGSQQLTLKIAGLTCATYNNDMVYYCTNSTIYCYSFIAKSVINTFDKFTNITSIGYADNLLYVIDKISNTNNLYSVDPQVGTKTLTDSNGIQQLIIVPPGNAVLIKKSSCYQFIFVW